MRNSNKKGFTLIELLIVVAIIGVLSALLMSNFVGIRQRARDGQRKSDVRQLQTALELYRADNGTYPATGAFNNCGSSFTGPGGTTTYMNSIPCDPLTKQSDYYYASANGTKYCIRACLENNKDPQINTQSGDCVGIQSCANVGGRSDYYVQNP